MFEVPRHRIRAYAKSLRRGQAARTSKQRAEFHIKRAVAQLSLSRGFAKPGEIVPARVILNDLLPGGIQVFSSRPLAYGLQVGLTLQHPKPFFAIARVTACKTLGGDARIITETAFPYRVKLEFEFSTRDEQEAVLAYCRELARDHLCWAG